MTKSKVGALTEKIAAHGFRKTAARRAILSALVEAGGHITADDLTAHVRKVHPRVGRMTVYRTLELLCELGVLRPIYQGTGAAQYVFMDQGSHHHLICNLCGTAIDFERCGSEALGKVLGDRHNFEIQAHLLEFYGVCQACRSPEE